jgi:hypothetical protein
VKKSLRIIGLAGISLLYCFVIGIYSGITFNADAAVIKHSKASDENLTAAVSAKSFHHTVQTENAVTAFSHPKPVSSKNSHNEYSSCTKIAEQLFVTSFLQYNFYSHKLLMRVQQTDLIFPFHYFW